MYAVYDNPGTYDGKNALTLSRTGQNNQVHSLVERPQLGAVAVDAERHSRDLESHDQRPAAAAVFLAVRSGRGGLQPPARLHGGERHQRIQHRHGRHQPRVLQLRQLSSSRTTSTWSAAGTSSRSAETGSVRRSRRSTTGRRNGQFTFSGQTTGLGLADFMLGRVSNFLQGNPVYDFDENDYIGAYVQDEWRIRSNLTVNAGLRWEPYLAIKNSKDFVSNFDEARFDAGVRSTVYPQAPPGPVVPRRRGIPGLRGDEEQAGPIRAASRRGLAAEREDRDSRRAGAASTTRRISSSIPGSPTIRRGARRSRSRARPAALPTPISPIRAAIPSRRSRPAGRRRRSRRRACT